MAETERSAPFVWPFGTGGRKRPRIYFSYTRLLVLCPLAMLLLFVCKWRCSIATPTTSFCPIPWRRRRRWRCTAGWTSVFRGLRNIRERDLRFAEWLRGEAANAGEGLGLRGAWRLLACQFRLSPGHTPEDVRTLMTERFPGQAVFVNPWTRGGGVCSAVIGRDGGGL